ncbi:unnamed protein product [Bursaphelenchus xylophilus]|nr:unnamed protein product [Bursaphelenchus xylophilus]CAG9128609.1 unnamed protein product [Bursaphelenchus xylophilus]
MCDDNVSRTSRSGSTSKTKKGFLSRTLGKLKGKAEEHELEKPQEEVREEIQEEVKAPSVASSSKTDDEASEQSESDNDSIDGEHTVGSRKQSSQEEGEKEPAEVTDELDESAQRLMEILKIKSPSDLTDSESEEIKKEESKPPVRSKKRLADVEKLKLIQQILPKPVIKSVIVHKHPVTNAVAEKQPVAQSDVQAVIVETRPQRASDGLKWHTDRPSPGGHVEVNKWIQTYAPLVVPLHLTHYTDSKHFYFDQPIDYLIAWSDGHDCCGFVKQYDDATENVPLVMRFGGFWTSTAVRNMYVGCTVRVRGYVRMKDREGGQRDVAPIMTRGCDVGSVLFAGIPSPSAFAIEWAVVSRPKIVRTLGTLVEDKSYQPNDKGKLLLGRVKDCEYGDEYIACSEKWPIPEIKELPPVPSPVILNYVEITERHVTVKCKDKYLLAPEYMESYFRTSDPSDHTFLFAWLDLSMTPSRTFDDI